jgi:RNA polymerase sigma-70 factor (ECF subfamily)
MTAAHDEDLDALMTRLADGDRSVFSLVFTQLWPPTLRLCGRLLESEADAADAAQQAMAKILERASDYDRKRSALPWALGIAAWECRTLRRKRVRRREVPEETAGDRPGQSSEDDLVRRDLIRAALNAMGALSEADQETLMITFLDEASAVSGATLRKRRERALERLRSGFRRLYGLD